jgi:hypothetical protein
MRGIDGVPAAPTGYGLKRTIPVARDGDSGWRDKVARLEAGPHGARGHGRSPGARPWANQAVQEQLVHPVLLRIQAEALIASGRLGTRSAPQRGVEDRPQRCATITDIGRLLAEGRTDDAVEAFKTAVTARMPDAWYELGGAHELA